jgi:hypothetical protein
MDSFNELKQQAEGLGLRDNDVVVYIRQQQEAARIERGMERDLEKLRLEREREKELVELEKRKLDHELALAQISHSPGSPSVSLGVQIRETQITKVAR